MLNFLSLRPDAFGLAVDDSSLKIAHLKKKGRFLSLSSWGSFPLKPGSIQDGEIKNKKELVEVIKNSLGRVKGRKLGVKNIIASLPEQKAFLQVIQMPKMKPEELRGAIRFEAENYIPLPIEDVYLDFEIVVPLRDHLDHLDVLISALPRETIDSYMECFREAGLLPLALEIESQSIARAMIKNQVAPFSVLLADVGQSSTGFSIFSGYSLRLTSSIPVSLDNFTKATAKTFKVADKEAEKMNQAYGIGGAAPKEKSPKNKKTGKDEIKNAISEAVTPVLTDLKEQIQKYLDYYRTHSSHEHLLERNKYVEKVILSGPGAALKGLSDFLSLELQIPVELGNPWINILEEPLKEVPGLPFEESLSYASVLGLALRAKNSSLL